MKWSDVPKLTSCSNYHAEHLLFEYFVKYIEEQIDAGLNLQPGFQREHVWTKAQQSAYIEYLVRGGKSGRDIWFNEPNLWSGMPKDGEYVCVDGLQRITAIMDFYHDRVPAFGHLYSEFEGKYPSYDGIVVHINNLQTRAEVLQWYIELNSTGVAHTEKEISKVQEMLDTSKRNGGYIEW